MKGGFSLCLIRIASSLVFIYSAASAADKVIVIPLNSSPKSSSPVDDPCEYSCKECTERPFQLTDNSGNLIANCKKNCDGKYTDCVSSTGYKFDYYGMYSFKRAKEKDGENEWNLDTTLYIGSSDLSYSHDFNSEKTDLYYGNNTCTGTVYVNYRPYKTTIDEDCSYTYAPATYEYIDYLDDWISESSAKGEGRIYGRVGGNGGKVYYVRPYTKYFLLNNSYKWDTEYSGGVWQCVCTNEGPRYVYPIYENDPSITGFQNTYNISPARTWWRNYHNFHY